VVRIVTALGARAAAFIMLPLARAPVLLARTAGSEVGTARSGAGAQDPSHDTGSLVGCHALPGIHTHQASSDLGVGVHRLQGRGLPFSSAAFVS
jgi:hypothetical protein